MRVDRYVEVGSGPLACVTTHLNRPAPTDRDLRPTRQAAVAALVVVAVVWGVSFAVVKDTVDEVAPAQLVALRFLVAAVVLLTLRPRVIAGLRRRDLWRGVLLGVLLASGFLLCTIGMQTTSVVISAFVLGTTVAFAPLVGWVWLRRRLPPRTALAVGLAVAGLALITVRGFALAPGVGFILTAAIVFAVHLVALERWSYPGGPYRLTVVQLATAGVLAFAVQLVASAGGGLGPMIGAAALPSVLGLGVVATAGAFLVLSWAQTRVDATTAAVLLTLEPVVGGVVGAVRGEFLSLPVVVGAAAVLAGAVLVGRR